MHLLYVDESGSVTDASQKYFVLAGVSVFERTTHGIEKSLDEIANKIEPESPQELELHGSPMRSGKGIWRKFDLATREALIVEALSSGVLRQARGVRLFGCAVEKTALSGKDPVHFCFEQLARRFDFFFSAAIPSITTRSEGLCFSTSPAPSSVCKRWRANSSTKVIPTGKHITMRKCRCF